MHLRIITFLVQCFANGAIAEFAWVSCKKAAMPEFDINLMLVTDFIFYYFVGFNTIWVNQIYPRPHTIVK